MLGRESPPSDDERWSRLLQQFERGTATRSELEELAALARERPDTSDSARESQAAVEQAFAATRHRLRFHRGDVSGRGSIDTWRFLVPARQAAAIVVTVIGVSAAVITYATRSHIHNARLIVAIYEAPRGQGDRTVQLVDGTGVVLAPGSHLVATMARNDGSRALFLDGEAEIRVVHNARRPFTVETKNATIRDIGTDFIVRSYATDPDVSVFVTRGVVAVSATTDIARPTVLAAGAMGRVTRTGAITTTTPSSGDADALRAWTSGQLIFSDTPLALALEELGRWYDLDVELADVKLAAVSVSGSASATTVKGALDAVAGAAGARWEQDGRKVRFFARLRSDRRVHPEVR